MWSNVCVQSKTFAPVRASEGQRRPTRANLSTGRESTCVVACVGLRDVFIYKAGLNGIFFEDRIFYEEYFEPFSKRNPCTVLEVGTIGMDIPRISELIETIFFFWEILK